jgi:molybdopterin-biosynthesis enzyme MoeA-like protein
MKDKASPEMRKLLFEVVENQLRDDNPKEVRITLQRLITEGCSESEAKKMLAEVVTNEIFDVLKEQKPFNLARYVERLKKLRQTL